MTSEWCDSHHWWKDAAFTKQNPNIPRNQIDEVEVDSSFFAYSILDNTQCFGQIPYLKANNLNIVLSTGGIVTGAAGVRGFFNCAELDAGNVTAGADIIFSHWYSDTYCQWNISSFSGISDDIEQIIFEGLDYFILGGTNPSINKSYIDADTIKLSGVTLKATYPYITKLIANGSEISQLSKLSFNSDRIQYQGSFLVNDQSFLQGTGNGKFIFKDSSRNKATLSGLCSFENSFNDGIIYGQNTLFVASGNGKTCINRGTIYGDAIFSGLGSINNGTVSGNSIFISGGINNGTILGSAVFYSGTSNQGTLANYSLFDYAVNNGTLVSGSKFTFSTNNNSVASGSGNFLFLNGSNNYGRINSSGQISFVSGSNNWGNLTAPSAEILFDLASFHRGGKIYGIASFGSGCSNDTAGIIVTGIFNNNSKNSGTISSLGIFNDISMNVSNTNNALFQGRSINSGTVSITGTFKGISQNISTVNNGCFYDNSYNNSGGIVQNNAIFYNQSSNLSGAKINTLAEFKEKSINYGDGSNKFNFFEDTINYGYIESENVIFSGSSINKNYAKKIHFYNTAKNDPIGSGYDAAFFNDSINNGYIKHSGHFYNTSKNQSLGVLNTGIFHNSSINNGSMRRPLVSGYEVLTSGYRKIDILDSGINKASLYNVEINFKNSGINQGKLEWSFNPLLIFTSSGIYNTGTTPYTVVETGSFRASYVSATIPSITFDDYTINRSAIIGYKDIKFLKESTNYGSIRTYPPIETNTPCVTFSGNQDIKNYGSIQNGASFSNGTNYGSIGSGYFLNSANSGPADSATFINSTNFNSIEKFATFNNSSNVGSINQSGFFYNSINNGFVHSGYFNESTNLNSLDIAQFSNSSKNSGNILQSGSFLNSNNLNKDSSVSLATFFGSSNNFGSVTAGYFYDQSINRYFGVVSEFYNQAINVGTIQRQAIFRDSSINEGLLADASFYNSSQNNQTGIGILSFNDTSKNNGVVNGIVSFISTTNYGIVIGRSDIYFTSGAINNGSISGNATFDLGSINDDSGSVSNNAIFLSGSFNNGFINRDAFFDNSYASDGIINNNAIFNNNSFCSNTTINGSATFNDISCYDKNTTIISGAIIKGSACNPDITA